jgi:hypothetical protein
MRADLEKKWKKGNALNQAISLLYKHKPPQTPKSLLLGQPFDGHLLALSPLYRRSRKLFIELGGSFVPSLISSPRTLTSPSLLAKVIEYSPIEAEYCWAAVDRRERQNSDHLLRLRTYASSLFHEQNHRILLELIPSAPPEAKPLRRYLNFMESLVVILDMALGDELGHLSSLFYTTGVTYDPGTDIKKELKQKRHYRNYLQAALHATYLNLEFYHPDDIGEIIRHLFPMLNRFADRASNRSVQLDREFIEKTNPFWQKKHLKFVRQTLIRPNQEPLILSQDPLDHRLQYLWAEKWFDVMGL